MTKRIAALLVTLGLAPVALAQTTTFTYQGRLVENGGVVTGLQDFEFRLFNAVSGGAQIGSVLTLDDFGVTNGLFTATLDFGANFPGAGRFLQIAVRPGASTGVYTPLTPRQPITATPYAIQAANATAAGTVTGGIPAAQITGTLPLAQLPASVVTNGASGVNFSGTFSGNGAGVTNLNMASSFGGGVAFELGATAFFLSSSPMVGDTPFCVLAQDVNGDGRADLISANFDSDTLTVLTNNGGGAFVVSSSPGVGVRPYSLAAGDVNGDGKVDLISGHEIGNALTVLTNNGSGGFVIASSPLVGDRPQWVAAADVNGDRRVDLISANYGVNTLSVLTNNGSGGFVLASTPGVGNGPYSVTAADVNGDGKADLISADISANTLSVLTNDGSGGFVLSSSPGVGLNPQVVVAADVNGDNKVDLISANQDDTLTVLTNNGSGGFVLSSSPPLDNWPFSVTAADVNGDGKVDLVSPLYGAASLAVLTNDGSGGFSLATSPAVRSGPVSVAAADFNGDGKVDLVSGHYGGGANTLTVLFNSRQLNGVFTGNGTGLSGVNAESLDGFEGSDFARLAASQSFTGENSFNNLTYFNRDTAFNGSFNYFYGDSLTIGASTFNGNIALGNSAALSFGAQTRQMLNLWGTQYGIGVQDSTLYSRCDGNGGNSGFIWYKGGVHNDNYANPGGGVELMHLVQGALYVNGALVPSSDRNAKENFAPVQPREVLEKVVALPLSSWNYKADTATRHLGPMAQDFYAAFNVGPDDKHIATVDADGVALAAIQGLNQKVELDTLQKDAEIAELKQQNSKMIRANAALLRRLEAIEARLK